MSVGEGAGLAPGSQCCCCCTLPMESGLLALAVLQGNSTTIRMSHVFTIYLAPSSSSCPKHVGHSICYGVGRNRSCWDEDCEEKEDARTQANEHDCYCIIKVEAAATGPHDATMQLQAAERCSPGCRGPALIDLYDPYPANRGLMGRDHWAKVIDRGGGAHLECLVGRLFPQVTFPVHPPLPNSNPSRLQEIPRSKGGLAQWID